MLTTLKKILLKGTIFLFLLALIPGRAEAQWPPFTFRLSSIYAEGKITYTLYVSKKFDGPMADLLIKIPLPPGTRFLEAGGPTDTDATFDGAEITFFTPTVHKPLRDLYFIVQVNNPNQTEFTSHAWISWKGDIAGNYLTGDYTIDITRTPLVWEKPASRLRLEAGAEIKDNIITYSIYPMNVGGRRMWDVAITLPLPPGASFVSATAPPPFEAGFHGRQAIFNILELEKRAMVGPLQVKISTTGITDTLVTAQAWGSWTNVGRKVDQQGFTKTGNIVVQPGTFQYVTADVSGDAPFENYDLTTVAFEPDGAALKTTFYTVGEMGPVGRPLEHYLYIDQDCNADTGKPRSNRGAEYWVRYRHQNGRGYIYTWNPELQTWENRQRIEAFTTGGPTAIVWVPQNIIADTTNFCWLAVARNSTEDYHPNPPIDWVGVDPRLTRYQTAPPQAPAAP